VEEEEEAAEEEAPATVATPSLPQLPPPLRSTSPAARPSMLAPPAMEHIAQAMLPPPPQRPPPGGALSVELTSREMQLLSSAQECLTAVSGVTKVRPRSPTVPKDNTFVLEERAAAREKARRVAKEKVARKEKSDAKKEVRRRKTAKRAALRVMRQLLTSQRNAKQGADGGEGGSGGGSSSSSDSGEEEDGEGGRPTKQHEQQQSQKQHQKRNEQNQKQQTQEELVELEQAAARKLLEIACGAAPIVIAPPIVLPKTEAAVEFASKVDDIMQRANERLMKLLGGLGTGASAPLVGVLSSANSPVAVVDMDASSPTVGSPAGSGTDGNPTAFMQAQGWNPAGAAQQEQKEQPSPPLLSLIGSTDFRCWDDDDTRRPSLPS